MGVRVCGMRVYRNDNMEKPLASVPSFLIDVVNGLVYLLTYQILTWTRNKLQAFDKKFGRSLTETTFTDALRMFFCTDGKQLRLPVIHNVIAKIVELEAVLRGVSGFRFYSSSLLVVYDAADLNSE